MFSLSHRPGPDRVNTRSDDVVRVARSGSGREPRSVRLQKLSIIPRPLLPRFQVRHCCHVFKFAIAATFSSSPVLPRFQVRHCCHNFKFAIAATFSSSTLLPHFQVRHCCHVIKFAIAATFSSSPLLPRFQVRYCCHESNVFRIFAIITANLFLSNTKT